MEVQRELKSVSVFAGGRERQRHCPWNELTFKAAVFLHRRDFKRVNQKMLKSE